MLKTIAPAALALFAATSLAQAPQVSGEVTKIDKATSRITLKHGEIKNLDMPPMTMIFRVRDGKMIDAVAVGDRVRFTAEKVEGSYMLTAIDKAE